MMTKSCHVRVVPAKFYKDKPVPEGCVAVVLVTKNGVDVQPIFMFDTYEVVVDYKVTTPCTLPCVKVKESVVIKPEAGPS